MEELLPFEKIKREILVKKEATTSDEFGCYPDKIPLSELINYGIINLNKPSGPTSHQVSDYVQKILYIKKSGHSGTLDPKVTGVLPIALGRATRVVQTLLKSGKEYIGLMHLHREVPESEINEAAKEFIGKIKQLPPIRSAVKRQIREREIYYLKILEISDKDVLFKIGCEAGFYIRKFCVQFADKLNINAHLMQLVRTKAGPFTEKTWCTLHDLKDSYINWKEKNNEKDLRKIILPIEAAVKHLPKIWILDSAVNTVCHGADLSVPGISKLESDIKMGDLVAILTLKNELVCLGKALIDSKDLLTEKKAVAVKTSKVFMQRNTYN